MQHPLPATSFNGSIIESKVSSKSWFRYLDDWSSQQEGKIMVKWEYHSVDLVWSDQYAKTGENNEEPTQEWVCVFPDEVIKGFDNIVNLFGSQGWEMLSITPVQHRYFLNNSRGNDAGLPERRKAEILKVVFKRPFESASKVSSAKFPARR